jgi:hypothetical protein
MNTVTPPTAAPATSLVARLRANLAGILVLVIVVGGGIVFLSGGASAADYSCSSYLTATDTPVGVQTPVADLGRTHVAKGSSITYAYCPPASGNHWPVPQAPLAGRVYGLTDAVVPGGYIHNLEHGYIVILYQGDDAGAADRLAALQSWYATAPVGPYCKLPTSTGLMVARADKLPAPVVALAWDIEYPLATVDTAALDNFIATHGDRGPEPMCNAAAAAAGQSISPDMTSASPTP